MNQVLQHIVIFLATLSKTDEANLLKSTDHYNQATNLKV